MNCKPGDLAVIVKVFRQDEERFIGKLVRVTTLKPGMPEPYWYIEEPIEFHGQVKKSVRDGALKPIRDPGDDAQDEMLRPLPQEIAA